MLHFIKKLFREEKPKSIVISVNELEPWFESHIKSKLSLVMEKLLPQLNRLENEVSQCKRNIDLLKNAKLVNPKIPERAINVMQGNKEAYIKRTLLFLEELKLNGRTPEEVSIFCKKAHSAVDSYARSTYRSYQVLQQFFAHESDKVSEGVRNIESAIKEAEGVLSQNKIDGIALLGSLIRSSKNKLAKKSELEAHIFSHKATSASLIEKEKLVLESLDNIKKSSQYTDYLYHEERITSLQSSLSGESAKINSAFFAIGRALRKYSKISMEHSVLVAGYLENPLASLIDDKDLKIFQALASLEIAVSNNKIETDERKKEKTLRDLKLLNKEFLKDLQKNYSRFIQQISELQNDSSYDNIKRDLAVLKEKLDQLKTEIQNIDVTLAAMDSELNKIDVEKIHKDLEAQFKETLKINIILN